MPRSSARGATVGASRPPRAEPCRAKPGSGGRPGYTRWGGPVAQWIERQTSNLRAEVRLLPGPLRLRARPAAYRGSACRSAISLQCGGAPPRPVGATGRGVRPSARREAARRARCCVRRSRRARRGERRHDDLVVRAAKNGRKAGREPGLPRSRGRGAEHTRSHSRARFSCRIGPFAARRRRPPVTSRPTRLVPAARCLHGSARDYVGLRRMSRFAPSRRTARRAAVLATIGFGAIAIFQAVLAAGVPLGHAAWGGESAEHTSELHRLFRSGAWFFAGVSEATVGRLNS